jgi:hypothetical protein
MVKELAITPDLSYARRSIRLAESFISNLGFYNADWIEKDGRKVLLTDQNFWLKANGNFLDIATLDVCKLFVDKSQDTKNFSVHNWKSFFPKHVEWLHQLFVTCSLNINEFEEGGKSKKITGINI